MKLVQEMEDGTFHIIGSDLTDHEAREKRQTILIQYNYELPPTVVSMSIEEDDYEVS